MSRILHITTAQQWTAAQQAGEYRAASLQTEGFIHASYPQQVQKVAQRFYRDVADLVVLVINSTALQADVRDEPGRYAGDSVDELFPHIYGPINLDAVGDVIPLQSEEDEPSS
jgi:uncharacterized protein (DUF952 family)